MNAHDTEPDLIGAMKSWLIIADLSKEQLDSQDPIWEYFKHQALLGLGLPWHLNEEDWGEQT